MTIAGNTVDRVLSESAMKAERHGIFFGNCQSLLIENNNLRLTRMQGTEELPTDGFRMEDDLGERLMITKNYMASSSGKKERSFTAGVRVEPV